MGEHIDKLLALSSRVQVGAYTREGRRVRGYVRTDPRASHENIGPRTPRTGGGGPSTSQAKREVDSAYEKSAEGQIADVTARNKKYGDPRTSAYGKNVYKANNAEQAAVDSSLIDKSASNQKFYSEYEREALEGNKLESPGGDEPQKYYEKGELSINAIKKDAGESKGSAVKRLLGKMGGGLDPEQNMGAAQGRKQRNAEEALKDSGLTSDYPKTQKGSRVGKLMNAFGPYASGDKQAAAWGREENARNTAQVAEQDGRTKGGKTVKQRYHENIAMYEGTNVPEGPSATRFDRAMDKQSAAVNAVVDKVLGEHDENVTKLEAKIKRAARNIGGGLDPEQNMGAAVGRSSSRRNSSEAMNTSPSNVTQFPAFTPAMDKQLRALMEKAPLTSEEMKRKKELLAAWWDHWTGEATK